VLSEQVVPPERVVDCEMCFRSRKEKLNAEQCQNSQDNMSLSESTHNNVSDADGPHDELVAMPGSTNCHRRLRDRINSSDIQLQQNISRPRAQRQIVLNENEPRDSHQQASVSGIAGLGESASAIGGDDGFGSVPEFRLESDIAMDISDMSLTGQDMPNNLNFVLASESSSTYRCGQDSRDSEYLRVKSGAASVPALNRTKNPRSPLSSASESQQNFTTACDPTANSTDHKPQQ
jgi:hypothetical protein